MNYEFIRVANYKQACAYVSNGVKPIDLEYDKELGRMIFIFSAEDTKEVWNLWKKHKLVI